MGEKKGTRSHEPNQFYHSQQEPLPGTGLMDQHITGYHGNITCIQNEANKA